MYESLLIVVITGILGFLKYKHKKTLQACKENPALANMFLTAIDTSNLTNKQKTQLFKKILDQKFKKFVVIAVIIISFFITIGFLNKYYSKPDIKKVSPIPISFIKLGVTKEKRDGYLYFSLLNYNNYNVTIKNIKLELILKPSIIKIKISPIMEVIKGFLLLNNNKKISFSDSTLIIEKKETLSFKVKIPTSSYRLIITYINYKNKSLCQHIIM